MKKKSEKVARRAISGNMNRQAAFLTMIIPGFILLILFCYLPMPGIILAFKSYKLAIPPKDFWIQNRFIYSLFVNSAWTGLDNFEFLIRSPDTFKILRNTLCYNILFMFTGIVLQVALAITVNEMLNRRGAKAYQSILFLPYFISWIIVMYVLYALINAKGVFNQLNVAFGNETVDYYSKKGYWPWFFTIANMWKYTGYGSIIYLATLSGFDQQLYEAAAIDGAGKWKQIRYIVIPQLVPTIIILQILAVGRIFNGDFEMFYSLPNGSGVISDVTYTIDVYVYNMMKKGSRLGQPAAGALFQSVFGFLTVMVTNFVVRKIEPDSALF